MISSLISVPVAGNATLDKGPVPCPTFRRVWLHANCLVMQVDLTTASIVYIRWSRAQDWLRLLEPTVNCRVHACVQGSGQLRRYMISAIIIRLILTTVWPRWWQHGCVSMVLLRKHCAHLLLLGLLCVAVDGRSQSRVPIYLFFIEGQWCLISYWHMGRYLLALHDNGRLLNVDEIDGIDSLGLVRYSAFNVSWRDDCHCLNHSNA